jgi:hypothetical protein
VPSFSSVAFVEVRFGKYPAGTTSDIIVAQERANGPRIGNDLEYAARPDRLIQT